MDTLGIILLVVVAVMLLLFAGGLIANSRRAKARETGLRAKVEAANAALAEAHAQDKGWEPATVESAARAAFAVRHPGEEPDELHLIQVVDRPGTDADQAIFRAVSGGRETTITLGRRDGAWVTE